MYIIQAKYLFVCDEKFTILKDAALCFDEYIKEIGKFELLKKKYPNAKLIKSPQNSLILPSFINPHTHLEFSTNSYELEYGDFLLWLKSVIRSRDSLSEEAKKDLISQTLRKMAKSGTGVVGEISSFGKDLLPCSEAFQRVIFFNELLGTNEAQNEAKKEEFQARFKQSLKFKSKKFIPALSLHSPYSTNLELAHFITKLAKEQNLLISTHFLESKHELLWLQSGKGGFKKWLGNFNKNAKPNYSPQSYIELFRDLRTLFTHCVFAKDLSLYDKNLHSITHCAYSNFLLSQGTFKLKKALQSGLNIHLGTDGLSSNISLSMLDEMRVNLLIHKDIKPQILAKKLILMATLYPAKALDLNLGQLKAGKLADFSVFEVKECEENRLPLQFILNAKEVTNLFIGGEQCQF